MASTDQDFVGVARGITGVAAAIKSLYPNGPPVPNQNVPDLRSPDCSRTRSAIELKGFSNRSYSSQELVWQGSGAGKVEGR